MQNDLSVNRDGSNDYINITPAERVARRKALFDILFARVTEAWNTYPSSEKKSAFCRIRPYRESEDPKHREHGKRIDAPKYLNDDKSVNFDTGAFTRDSSRAYSWIERKYNVGLYCGTNGTGKNTGSLAIIDFDMSFVDPEEDGRLAAPEQVVLSVVKQTFSYRTRSGGFQCVVVNDLGLQNCNLIWQIDQETGEEISVGEFRTERQYGVCNGWVDPDDVTERDGKVKKSLPTADGWYTPISDVPIIPVSKLVLPGGFSFKSITEAKITKTKRDGSTYTISRHTHLSKEELSEFETRRKEIALEINPVALHSEWKKGLIHLDEIYNLDGMSFQYLLEYDDDIKSFFETPAAHVIDTSDSAIDFVAEGLLIDRGFSDIDIARIIFQVFGDRPSKDGGKRGDVKYPRVDYIPSDLAKIRIQKRNRSHQIDPSDESELGEPLAQGFSPLVEWSKEDDQFVNIMLDAVPDELDVAANIIMLKGSPRSWKSHRARHHAYTLGSATYVVPKHEVGKAQYEKMVQETEGTGLTIVYRAGKNRCCNFRDDAGQHSCKTCPYRPANETDDTGIHVLSYQKQAKRMLYEMRTMHPDVLRGTNPNLCIYYLLKYAEADLTDHPDAEEMEFSFEPADICITVPQIYNNTNPDDISLATRDLLILDEDPTVTALKPNVVPLCMFARARGKESFHVPLIDEDYGDILDKFVRVKKALTGRKGTKVVKALRGICDNIETLVKDVKVFRDKKVWGKKAVAEFIESVQAKMSFFGEYSPKEKLDVIRAFKKEMLEIGVDWKGEVEDPSDYLHPFLYPETWLLHYNTSKKPAYSINMISADVPMIYPQERQVLFIGSVEAELFAHAIRNGKTVVRYEITKFPYSENYVYVVCIRDTVNKELAIVDDIIIHIEQMNQEARLAGLTDMELGERPRIYPMAIFNNTKENQASMINMIGSRGDVRSVDSYRSKEAVYDMYETGFSVAMYLNGPQVRGIDVPQFDVVALRRLGFATPRWDALISWAKGTPSYDTYRKIRDTILSDETTNACFRTAPIPGTGEDRAKIVFLSKHYLDRIYPAFRENSTYIPFDKNVENYLELAKYMAKSLSSYVEVVKRKSDGVSDVRFDSISSYSTGTCNENNRIERVSYGVPVNGKSRIEETQYLTIKNEIPRTSLRKTRTGKSDHRLYNLVRGIVVPYLRSHERAKIKTSMEPLISRVYEKKEVRAKKISRDKIREVIEMLLEDQILVVDEEAMAKYHTEYNPMTWVKLNPLHERNPDEKPVEVKKTLDDFMSDKSDEQESKPSSL